MSFLQWVGLFLVVVGVGEFLVFRSLAPNQQSIARKLPLLTANSVFNVLVGIALVVLFR